VPVAASLAIVSRSHLRPQPWGLEVSVSVSPFHIAVHYPNLTKMLASDSNQKLIPGGNRYFRRHYHEALS
jgi:hypothetical protein